MRFTYDFTELTQMSSGLLKQIYSTCTVTLVAFAIFSLGSPVLLASHDPVNGDCPAEITGALVNCVAQDIEIAVIRSAADPGSIVCVTGDDVVLPLEVEFASNANSSSHDVAMWFSLEPGTNILAPPTSGPDNCASSVLDFPLSVNDDQWGQVLDLDTGLGQPDNCGDVDPGQIPQGETDTAFTQDFGDLPVLCSGSTGGSELEGMVTWHEKKSSGGPLCSEGVPSSYGNINKSKCSTSTEFFDLVVIGLLEICKAAPDGTDGAFEFTINEGTVWTSNSIPADPTVAPSPFTLNPADGTGGVMCETFQVMTTQGQVTNLVTIQETGVPLDSGFAVSDISCVNNDGGDVTLSGSGDDWFSIMLSEGDLGIGGTDIGQSNVTCTFTNSRGGSITITKDAEPNDAQDFSFVTTGTGYAGGFTLDDDEEPTLSNQSTVDELTDGQYTVMEAAVTGWDITDISCSGDDSSTVTIGADNVTIDLLEGEDISCTFVNTKRGTIIVEKQTDPDGSSQPFAYTFTGDFSGASDETPDDSIADDEQIIVSNVLPGEFTATEIVVDGWDLIQIQCSGDSARDGETATANIVVAPGETVTCIFDNFIRRGNIVVVKEVAGPVPKILFGFTPSWGEMFYLVAGNQNDSGDLLPTSEAGAYSVEETDSQLPWVLFSTECDDGSDVGAINLAPGETVTCTFVNGILAPVPVNNTWALLLMLLMLIATGWYFRPVGLRKS